MFAPILECWHVVEPRYTYWRCQLDWMISLLSSRRVIGITVLEGWTTSQEKGQTDKIGALRLYQVRWGLSGGSGVWGVVWDLRVAKEDGRAGGQRRIVCCATHRADTQIIHQLYADIENWLTFG